MGGAELGVRWIAAFRYPKTAHVVGALGAGAIVLSGGAVIYGHPTDRAVERFFVCAAGSAFARERRICARSRRT